MAASNLILGSSSILGLTTKAAGVAEGGAGGRGSVFLEADRFRILLELAESTPPWIGSRGVPEVGFLNYISSEQWRLRREDSPAWHGRQSG
jgi:hypothetical protein